MSENICQEDEYTPNPDNMDIVQWGSSDIRSIADALAKELTSLAATYDKYVDQQQKPWTGVTITALYNSILDTRGLVYDIMSHITTKGPLYFWQSSYRLARIFHDLYTYAIWKYNYSADKALTIDEIRKIWEHAEENMDQVMQAQDTDFTMVSCSYNTLMDAVSYLPLSREAKVLVETSISYTIFNHQRFSCELSAIISAIQILNTARTIETEDILINQAWHEMKLHHGVMLWFDCISAVLSDKDNLELRPLLDMVIDTDDGCEIPEGLLPYVHKYVGYDNIKALTLDDYMEMAAAAIGLSSDEKEKVGKDLYEDAIYARKQVQDGLSRIEVLASGAFINRFGKGGIRPIFYSMLVSALMRRRMSTLLDHTKSMLDSLEASMCAKCPKKTSCSKDASGSCATTQ